ncbi:S8 family serine peptidase [Cesiribacter sp. SM1]|uniref:S8 family serine peptidase n=1 Tax=Cesiribacter sp. SM1 TaxID=2861196 RepID=UPI001CD71A5A|nr:S8 family serine peptidase [Cesiribacter sp. SM1]
MQNNYFRGGAALLLAAVMGLSSCQQDEELESVSTDFVEPGQSAIIEGQYIVVLKEEAINGRMSLSGDYEERKAAVKSAVLSMFANARLSEDMLDQVYGSAIYGFSARLDEATVARLQKDPKVAYVEKDRIIMLAPPSGKGPGGGGSTAQVTPWGIARVGGAGDGAGKTAWVIDSGIDLDHPDLNVDGSRGFNAFTSGRDSGAPDDGNGHGTHVAGTIAALNNSVGVVGVAAGATVVPVKVLDSRGSGSYSGVIAGVDFVGANGRSGDVANMSLGGPVSDALDRAVVNASNARGVKFVLAAGNETDNANNHSPARANGPNVYTISAMNSSNRWASFSNFGNPPVDYCAPGVSINSTWKEGGYNSISGTSMAAPHAAGVLLLGAARTDGYVSGDPDGNPDAIIHR